MSAPLPLDAAAWPNRALLGALGISVPILQAPMAGFAFGAMAEAVSRAGGLGSLACASLSPQRIRAELARGVTPVNLNFFCHAPAPFDAAREAAWRERLKAYYVELGVVPAETMGPSREPFGEESCALVEELRPRAVSFHFGLPEERLLARVKATGAVVLSSATTVEEAVYLEEHGCDAIIAQGAEAGGHRGMFLTTDVATQRGLFVLLPRVVEAVKVPVIAAGGIADATSIVAAMTLGASAVQLGTVYLSCPEAQLSVPHRALLEAPHETAITNVFTGRPARGIVNRLMREVGPISDLPPAYPHAARALATLRASAEAAGSGDFSPLWAGEAAHLGRPMRAEELTETLARETLSLLSLLSTGGTSARN